MKAINPSKPNDTWQHIRDQIIEAGGAKPMAERAPIVIPVEEQATPGRVHELQVQALKEGRPISLETIEAWAARHAPFADE